jgi:hypothetical protein
VTASLINSGLGPAIINRFEVSVDNQHFPITEPEELVALMTKHLSGQLVLDQCTTSVLRKGHAMSKDAKVELAKIAFKNVTTAQFSEFKKFQVRVDYESAYGEKFSYDSRNHLA